MFKRTAGIDIVHVLYKGGSPALAAVIAGKVQMTFSNLSVALPQVTAGHFQELVMPDLIRHPVRCCFACFAFSGPRLSPG